MKKPLLIAAMLTASAGAASAASETMTFTGTVSATCQITIDSGGVLGASADLMTLSTTEAGGSAGTATIQASDSSFQVTAVAPASFTSAPAVGNTGVTFAALYSASGATTATEVDGSVPTALEAGLTNLSVDLEATKSDGAFPAGEYSADVTITCE